MNIVLRVLGIELVARLAARLPGGLARAATALLLVVVNLLPVWAVVTERAGMGDVFLVYWFENVVVWLCGIVRIATAEGTDGSTATVRTTGGGTISSAGFFALHYGIFTLVHGVFAGLMAILVGLEGGFGQVLVLSAAIVVSHLFSLGVNWFGRDERKVVSEGTAMFAPYPRMLVLHIAIITGFFVVLGGPGEASHGGQVTAVTLLCGMKTLIDLAFHLREHRSRQVVRNGLYGAPSA